MNIALMGFSRTGKTTIAKLLAKKLNKKLISTDEEIAKKTKTSTAKLIKKCGWEKFLNIEAEVVEDISDFDECIFDTGESVIMRNENIINFKKNGLVVFLTADIKEAAKRIKKFTSVKKIYPDRVKDILQEREHICKKVADYIIDTSRLSPEDACDLIMHYMQMEIQ